MVVVCISPHPDDMEMGCAGTLLKLQDQGHEVISIVTVKPSAVVRAGRSMSVINDELQKSQQISKFKTVVFDTELHENGRPNLKVDNVTMTALSKVIPSVIDIAIIPNAEDYHQDHRNTFNLAFPIVQSRAAKVWSAHAWPYHAYHKTPPTLFRDITDYWDTKQAMLDCYSSYLSATDIEQIKITNQYWAYRNTGRLAEAFSVLKDYE